MKKILLISFLTLLTSCGIQYDGDERFLITGKLINEDNVPIANHKVEVMVREGFTNDNDLICYTETNEDGIFEMVFPRPVNADAIDLICGAEHPVYHSKKFINIKNTNFSDFKFNVNSVILFKKEDISKLEIILNQVNPDKVIKQFKLIGNLPKTEVDVNPIQNDDSYYYSYYVEDVIKNQTIIAEYIVFDSATNQSQTLQQQIVINADNITQFTIDY